MSGLGEMYIKCWGKDKYKDNRYEIVKYINIQKRECFFIHSVN